MDQEQKLFMGRILGEIFRIQKRMEPNFCGVNDSTIFGLINGFDTVIDEQLRLMGNITDEEVTKAADVLAVYFKDEAKLQALKGFYDIEHDLAKLGIDRSKAIQIFTYFKLDNSFTDVIEKFDSSGSPTECRRFEPGEWEI